MASVAEPTYQKGPAWDEDGFYEVVDGQRVELLPMSFLSHRIASLILAALEAYGEIGDRGQAIMEALFHLPLPVNRLRRPDVAYISSERYPRSRPIPWPDNAFELAPDLAVEIVSPSDLVAEITTKLDEYFRAGVRSVWVVYPNLCLVQVYTSLTDCKGFARNDTLDGGALLPGFSLPLAKLFAQAPLDA